MNKKSQRIVVVQNGFVFIGEWHPATAKNPACLTSAHNIRKWGTTAGLGQIAIHGPTPGTVLDPVGIVVFDTPGSVLFTIECSYAA